MSTVSISSESRLSHFLDHDHGLGEVFSSFETIGEFVNESGLNFEEIEHWLQLDVGQAQSVHTPDGPDASRFAKADRRDSARQIRRRLNVLLARRTVDPLINAGIRLATGVTLPVRPT